MFDHFWTLLTKGLMGYGLVSTQKQPWQLIQQTVLKMEENSQKMSMVESVLETKIQHLACYIFFSDFNRNPSEYQWTATFNNKSKKKKYLSQSLLSQCVWSIINVRWGFKISISKTSTDLQGKGSCFVTHITIYHVTLNG